LIDKPIFVLLSCIRPCRFYWIVRAFARVIALAAGTLAAIATDRRYVLASSWRRAAHFDTPEGLVGTNVVSANVPN
jgi:hypothetical protein